MRGVYLGVGLYALAAAMTLEGQVDEILEEEALSGDAVAQYNQQDLTSLFVETDGSGGNPTVGDSVGFIADTARFEGKTFDQFIASQTDLTPTLTDESTGAATATISGNTATIVGTDGSNRGRIGASLGVTIGTAYIVRVTTVVNSGAGVVRGGHALNGTQYYNEIAATNNQQQFIAIATNTTLYITSETGSSGGNIDVTIDLIAAVPGYHLIAASDAARPVLLDSFDQSGAALTDNGGRGDELVSNPGGPFTSLDGWTLRAGNGAISLSGGEITNSSTDASRYTSDAVSVEIGAEYEVDWSGFDPVATSYIRVGTSDSGSSETDRFDSGDSVGTFRATADTIYVSVVTSAGVSANLASISVKRISTAFDERGGELAVGDWTVVVGSNIAASDTSVVFTSAADNERVDLPGGVTAGTTYEIITTVNSISEGGVRVRDDATTLATYTAVGTYSEIRKFSGTQLRVTATGTTTADATISVKQVIYPNLVTNPTFDSDTDWTKGTGWSISGGVATSAGSNFEAITQDIGATASRWYRILHNQSGATQGLISYRLGQDTTTEVQSSSASDGWQEVFIRCGSADSVLRLYAADNGGRFDGDIDNVIVQEVPSSIERIYFLSTDGSDDQIETDFTGSTSDTIVMAVRTSDTNGILLRGDTSSKYLALFNDGSGSSIISSSSGSPTFRLDGSAWAPASRDEVHSGLADENFHVVTIQGANLSSWTKVVLGFFSSSSATNTAYDSAYGPVILPDPSAEDLATIEKAAAAACGVTLA